MNEFTKEELQILQWEINTAINKLEMASLSCEKHSALNEKIQSMIDNYCEHETEQGGSGGDMLNTCKKCGQKYRAI